MRICVKDLSGTGSRHDPLAVSFIVIGGGYCDNRLAKMRLLPHVIKKKIFTSG